MRNIIGAALCAFAALAQAATAQTPVADLAKPPPGAQHFLITSTGGRHGESWIWRDADGALRGRESMNLRGQVFETDARAVQDANGMLRTLDVRGVTPQGDAAETFALDGAQARWKSPVDTGATALAEPRFYVALGGPAATSAWLLERVLASPDKTLKLLPSGALAADRLTSIEVGAGSAKKTVTAWALTGLSPSPIVVWANADNTFFGLAQGLTWLPDGYQGDTQRLEDAQAAALAARMPELARRLARTPTAPVVFKNVRLYDADARAFREGRTVVVRDGKIAAVGRAGLVRIPKGAEIIDGAGKTLLPGLWDCHMHVGDDFTGIQELSLGVTSVRDPGNDDGRTMDRRARAAKGELLFPNVYASSLIDGKGPYTAQVANVAESQEQAIALVRRAKDNGFVGVKFYGTLNPDWLKPAIAEAHRLGLHVHGHIPAGIRPMDAIADGYDEITHINWIIMQAMPDDVIKVSNGFARFEGPGRYAKDVDLDAAPMQGMLAEMARKQIASDPTMVAFEGIYVAEGGKISPAYAPFVGTMPATTERALLQGGFAVPKDLTRADYLKSWAKMVELLGRMHKAGIPIVAGTDGSGIELVHELEIYVEAGMSPADALATATIAPAKLVGQDAKTGSIKVGKAADLVLVEGDPSTRIGDLRQTRIVMLGGKMLDADALRAAAGFAGRPK
ncbi:MAG: amidohydrolase family protein [Alphaproteobacteria bacterium]|nr:amidohydrolase family protein [Alphaproteobacteria bacterium]